MTQTGQLAGLTTISIRVTDPPLELLISEKAFRPNPTTVRFARTVRIAPGDVVFDIGTGIGPLAIMAALAGASHVYAVDPVPLHIELARMNIAKHNVQDKVHLYQGDFFEPFDREPDLRGVKADVVIGDVSGIADAVSRALGWYSEDVPTGGPDGTDVIIDLLSKAGRYMKPNGALYFPIAVDLSDSGKILDAANARFHEVINAMDKPVTQFPLSEQEVAAIHAAYPDGLPSFINVQPGRRAFWRGQIWKAAKPR